jgi:hypothetical protein
LQPPILGGAGDLTLDVAVKRLFALRVGIEHGGDPARPLLGIAGYLGRKLSKLGGHALGELALGVLHGADLEACPAGQQ